MPNRRRSSLKRSRVGLQHWRWGYRSLYPKRKHLHQSAPLFHRAFKRWLKESQPKLGVRLKISGRRGESLMLRFVSSPDCISVSISPAEVSVAVRLEGQFVDYLLCLDMSIPVRVGDQIFCEVCQPESRIAYPDIEAYWRGHQFEAFGDWIISSFALAKWVCIYESWAALSIDDPDPRGLVKTIRLRPD